MIVNEQGGILNDPVLLRLGENHFWLSLSDSDILFWAQGVAVNSGLNVFIQECRCLIVLQCKDQNWNDYLFGEISKRFYYMAS